MKESYECYKKEILERNGIDETDANDIINMLDKEKDHRSVDSKFLDDFCKDNGRLHQFLVKVKKINSFADIKDRLVVCFRGSNIIIYKNNHVLWNISKDSETDDYKVEFNFNHARYREDWENILSGLCSEDIGYKVNVSGAEKKKQIDKSGLKPKYREKEKVVTGGDIGTIQCIKHSYSKEFVDYTYDVLDKLINSFMIDSTDYFRKRIIEIANRPGSNIRMADKIHESGSNPYIEKRWQQRLFHHFKNRQENGKWIFAYDLEFSQRYPNMDIKEVLEANEPDMMAIQFDDEGNAEKLLLIEIKSTYSVCWTEKKNKDTGEYEHHSDLWEHVKGMKAYCEMPFFIHSRIIDAHKIIGQYKDTGLYESLSDANIDSILSLTGNDIERIILFTNNQLPKEEKITKKKSAMDFYHSVDMRKKLKKLIETDDPDCKIWITESDYFSEKMDIKEIELSDL